MPIMPTIPSMPPLLSLPDAIVPAISWQSIVAALTTLVHGSTTDIGWLANHPKLPAVRDRTDQYARTLRQVMQGHHSLPDDLIYLLIPGLFSNLSPLYLLDTREHFSSLGLTCEIAKIDSQAGVEANARVLRDTVTALLAGKADEGEEIYAHGFPSQVSATSATHSNGSSGAAAGDEKSAKRQRVGEGAMRSKSETGNASGTGNGGNKSGNGSADGDSNSNRKRRVLLIGHSKGGLDAAAALALFPAQLNSSTVAGLVCMQSPYGGTPMASDILREGSLGNGTLRSVLELLLDKLFKGDIRCLEDLTYTRRHAFLSHHPLPPSIPCLSFHTNASRAPAVIVSLSTITHTEIPWLARTSQKLALAFPLSAALAALSLYLENRYGAESDGLVTRADAEVPGSIVVRARRQMDHGFMVFPSMGQSRRANGAGEEGEVGGGGDVEGGGGGSVGDGNYSSSKSGDNDGSGNSGGSGSSGGSVPSGSNSISNISMSSDLPREARGAAAAVGGAVAAAATGVVEGTKDTMGGDSEGEEEVDATPAEICEALATLLLAETK